MLYLQIHNCGSLINPCPISHCNNFAISFNIFLGANSMAVDASCLTGNLLIQHIIFPIRKQLHSLWIFHQSCTITKFDIELIEINFKDIWHYWFFFYHITICWIFNRSLDGHLSRIQNSDRFCHVVLNKKIRSYTK